jgi:hypothetical protein
MLGKNYFFGLLLIVVGLFLLLKQFGIGLQLGDYLGGIINLGLAQLTNIFN